jgi:hypothetical protein
MTAGAFHEPRRAGWSFSDASPAEVRAALIPEEAAEFDQQWREAIGRATEMLDLSEVLETLDSWRRVARLTAAAGAEAHLQLSPAVERPARRRVRLLMRLGRGTAGGAVT